MHVLEYLQHVTDAQCTNEDIPSPTKSLSERKQVVSVVELGSGSRFSQSREAAERLADREDKDEKAHCNATFNTSQ